MDSLLLLCARRIVAKCPLPALPDDLYPVLFQAAFLDGRALVLRDLVASWPFPVLKFQQLLWHRMSLRNHRFSNCIRVVIQTVAAQLWRELEEPSHDFRLRLLDMTGLLDSAPGRPPATWLMWLTTDALAKTSMEVSKRQQEFQKRKPKRHKGHLGVATAAITPQPLGVDVHTDLFITDSSYRILCEALQDGATSPLHLKCREFHAENISASEIVTLLESLDPSCVRRLDLSYNKLGLTGLSVILPHLLRFPELRSLKVQYNNVDVQHLTPESAIGIRRVANQLGMLPSLRELSLGSSRLSGNLCQILCDLQAPLESLELGSCSLVPDDLIFLSQSIHAPALKRLDLSGQDISQGLLEPLQLLLMETSASLLSLDLMHCCMADCHLATLLPTLLRCSRLRFLRLHSNRLSTAVIKDLLLKTLKLPDLHLVVYPVPMDCYKLYQIKPGLGYVIFEKFFMAAEAEISQLLANSGRTDLVWTSRPFGHEALDYFSL